LIIKLVRHGESEANIGLVDGATIGNCNIPLTPKGFNDADMAGETLGGTFIEDALLYCSPYLRTRQTIKGIIAGAGYDDCPFNRHVIGKVYEDPRLREVDWGYQTYAAYDDCLNDLKDVHGPFYTRRTDGESCADCYDRISTFLESMWRQFRKKDTSNVLIVSHGLTIRTFVMRFMHLQVEQFGLLRNPKNCDIITISNEEEAHGENEVQWKCGKWGVSGLRLRDELTTLFGTEKNSGFANS